MHACERIRPLLALAAEGELGPDEALAVGRHVEDCTACRILMARERRLARMVGGLDDPIEVDESFLDGVMQELPAEPPCGRRSRRGIKLAGLAILLALLGGAVFGSLVAPSWAGATSGPVIAIGGAGSDRGVSLGDALAGFAATLASTVLDGGSVPIEAPSVAGSVVVAAAAVLGCGLLLAAILAVLAARALRATTGWREG